MIQSGDANWIINFIPPCGRPCTVPVQDGQVFEDRIVASFNCDDAAEGFLFGGNSRQIKICFSVFSASPW
jgi:hypothetical protein